jgi:hypothetical protein
MKILDIYNSPEQEEIKFPLLSNLCIDWDNFEKLYPGYKAYKVKSSLHDFYVLKYNGSGFLVVDLNLVVDSITHYVTDKESLSIFVKLAMTKSQYASLYSNTPLDFNIPD